MSIRMAVREMRYGVTGRTYAVFSTTLRTSIKAAFEDGCPQGKSSKRRSPHCAAAANSGTRPCTDEQRAATRKSRWGRKHVGCCMALDFSMNKAGTVPPFTRYSRERLRKHFVLRIVYAGLCANEGLGRVPKRCSYATLALNIADHL